MPEILTLGTAAGDASCERTHASLLIKVNDNLYQFDAGEGVSSSLERQRIDHSLIGTIIITHMHPDHIAGLFMELQAMHLARRSQPISIYVPSEAKDTLAAFLNANYLFEESLGFEMTLRPVIPDPVFRDENMTVYARANRHLGHYADIVKTGGYPNKLESYSYVIKTETAKIIYSGDVDSVEDYADLLPDSNLLITEGLHVDHEQLFKAVSTNDVSHLVITHLTDEMYRHADDLRVEAKKFGVANLHIAYDGFSLHI
jgi:ribonuclease BN (tRNA processing enzyme)